MQKELWIEAENRVYYALADAIVTGCEHVTEMVEKAEILETDVEFLGEDMVQDIATEVWKEYWTQFE